MTNDSPLYSISQLHIVQLCDVCKVFLRNIVGAISHRKMGLQCLLLTIFHAIFLIDTCRVVTSILSKVTANHKIFYRYYSRDIYLQYCANVTHQHLLYHKIVNKKPSSTKITTFCPHRRNVKALKYLFQNIDFKFQYFCHHTSSSITQL